MLRGLGRKLTSWGVAVLALPLAIVSAPIWVPLSALADLVGRLRRFPTVRLGLFAVIYLAYQWAAMALATWLWLIGGLGRNLDKTAHRKVQAWWAGALLGWARRLLGVELDFGDTSDLPSDTFILASRHASMVDAVLPIPLICTRLGRFAHYVLKDQLRWDPAIGLFGGRLGNEFVTRGRNTADDLAAVRSMAQRALDRSVIVIFPEGTYATDRSRKRILDSLRRRFERGELEAVVLKRAEGFRRLLPPKPGGFNQLLAAQPDADVVILGHVGLEGVAQLRGLRRRLPLSEPVTVRWWVHPRSQVPDGEQAVSNWLYQQWQRLDTWVDNNGAKSKESAGASHKEPEPESESKSESRLGNSTSATAPIDIRRANDIKGIT